MYIPINIFKKSLQFFVQHCTITKQTGVEIKQKAAVSLLWLLIKRKY
jgi:hypothetical protein